MFGQEYQVQKKLIVITSSFRKILLNHELMVVCLVKYECVEFGIFPPVVIYLVKTTIVGFAWTRVPRYTAITDGLILKVLSKESCQSYNKM